MTCKIEQIINDTNSCFSFLINDINIFTKKLLHITARLFKGIKSKRPVSIVKPSKYDALKISYNFLINQFTNLMSTKSSTFSSLAPQVVPTPLGWPRQIHSLIPFALMQNTPHILRPLIHVPAFLRFQR